MKNNYTIRQFDVKGGGRITTITDTCELSKIRLDNLIESYLQNYEIVKVLNACTTRDSYSVALFVDNYRK